jgi:hypothetical protein
MAAVAREAFLAFTLQDRKPTSVAMVLSTVAALLLVVLASVVDDAWRPYALRAVLLLIAVGELVGGVTQAFLTRPLFARAGRPYHPGHHGIVQDFGLYDLAMAAILVCIAIAPQSRSPVLGVVTMLYAVHGLVHLLRSRRLLAGADPDPGADLRQGLPLLIGALGLLLFRP